LSRLFLGPRRPYHREKWDPFFNDKFVGLR
jgi:hypothetical protein